MNRFSPDTLRAAWREVLLTRNINLVPSSVFDVLVQDIHRSNASIACLCEGCMAARKLSHVIDKHHPKTGSLADPLVTRAENIAFMRELSWHADNSHPAS